MPRQPAAPLFARLRRHLLIGFGLGAGATAGFFANAQAPTPPISLASRSIEFTAFTGKRRDALVDIVEKVKAAVVNIHSERLVAPTGEDPFRGGPFQSQRQNGMGTGIVLDGRGYVVTNYHVIDDIQSLRVRLHDGKQMTARVLATDKKADLALIKIEAPTPLPTVPLGTASDLLDAEQVIAIGNAFGYEHTVSIGNVAYKSRDVSLNKEISYQGLIQTTAPINPGNSGGPLFNKKGELIGVNVAIRAGAQNIAFAIPVDTMIDRAAEMLSSKKRGGTRHGLIVKDHAERAGEEGAVLRTVTVEAAEILSPAATAGVKAGDIVLMVGDIATQTTIDVERGFLEKPAGEAVPLTVRRNGETLSLTLTLIGAEKSATTDVVVRRMGMKLLPVGKEIVARVDAQLRGGMAVQEVIAGTAAAKAGLQKGDVLIGFHLWEAVNLDNVLFVLNHKELASFNPVKTFFIRDGRVRETALIPAE